MAEYLIVAVSITTLVATLMAVLLIWTQRFRADTISTEIKFDAQREYYERTIHQINDKMMRDQQRWEELNHLVRDSVLSLPDVSKEPNLGKIDSGIFLRSLGIVEKDLQFEARQVFVLTSFSNRYLGDFEEIRSACQELGLNAKRGDEEIISGNILPYIVRQIAVSRFVIANLSGRNPNVFYELGIAQALGKPAIIVSRSERTIPFDLRQQQLIFFKESSQLRDEVKSAISKLALNRMHDGR
ncbi:hypothetical protein BA950_10635 [Erythrobacter sp. SAORIC-644]|uniref:hypothetical protein n=1 Tax=Erythrobacter sp. SAORIC-644 TaxID=1869314 RepID=UPI000C9FD368|nr:hypothetical protein [Erythrobacter sp. SAORIC-644]PNQ76236.1 hypothetical protein BA950_10635 [Erythrobacter sp. SAORIC-644]